jgi:integrase
MDSMPLAPATVNSKRGTIVALANYAADCGRLAPLKRIKKMVVGTDPPDSWSAEEYSALLHAAGRVEGDWHGVPAWLCWEFGIRLVTEACCRFGELWVARVEDVDLERRIWLSRARDRKGRRQGLRHQFTERTAELIRMSLDQSGWLVPSPRTRLWPFPYGKETQWVHFKRLLRAAGLSATRRDAWHKLRRTGESFLAAEVGVDLAAAYAGHTPEVARRHYIDACRGEERGFADVIAEKLACQKPPPLRLFSVG